MDLLEDLVEDVIEVGNDFEIVVERLSDGGELDDQDIQVCLPVNIPIKGGQKLIGIKRLQSGVIDAETVDEAAILSAFDRRIQTLYSELSSFTVLHLIMSRTEEANNR